MGEEGRKAKEDIEVGWFRGRGKIKANFMNRYCLQKMDSVLFGAGTAQV